MKSETNRYNYRSKEHREWAIKVKAAANGKGCYICGRGAAPKRKGQRLHSHHIYGTKHKAGVQLCPTCHKLVDLLAGPAKGVFTSRGKWRKLLRLASMKLSGPEWHCEGGDNCVCE